MSAESTTLTAPDGQFFGTQPLRFLRFDTLARVLGFGSPKAPPRPVLRHPLERLTILDGAVCEIYGGQPGRQYLSPCGVEVLQKLSFRELDPGQCEYRFELSGPADPVWRSFFKKLLPGFSVRLDGAILTLVCSPADLESSFGQIKNAMAWANVWHEEENEALIARVLARDEERKAEREMEENRRQGLQRQFDYLQL